METAQHIRARRPACQVLCDLSVAHNSFVHAVMMLLLCSVAILSDAAHMFSDVFSFLVSIYSMRLIKMKATSAYSFGYHRAETIGALISVLIVCVITGGLVLEAVQRLIHPTDIDGRLMFIVATTGIGFNVLLLMTLGHDHHHHLGGGSCGHHHDHGDSHCGHDHGHSHAHGGSHDIAGPCDHAHDHAHGSGGHGCDSAHSGHKECTGHSQHQASQNGHNGHIHCSDGHHHDHDHAHAPDHSPKSAANAMERLSVERTSSHGLLHVTLEPAEAGGYLDSVDVSCAPRSRSRGHGTPGHMHCMSHDHANGHSHGHEHSSGPHGDHHNQNLRGAIVHVMGDIMQSVGVAIAGAIIWCASVHV